MYSAEVWPRVPRRRASSRATAGSAQAPAPAPAATIASSSSARPGSTDCATESTRLTAAHARPGPTAPTTTISRRVRTPASAACQAPAAPPSAAAANTISDPAPTCARSAARGSSSSNRPRTNTSSASSAAATPAPVARTTGRTPADRTACMLGDASERLCSRARGPGPNLVLGRPRPSPGQPPSTLPHRGTPAQSPDPLRARNQRPVRAYGSGASPVARRRHGGWRTPLHGGGDDGGCADPGARARAGEPLCVARPLRRARHGSGRGRRGRRGLPATGGPAAGGAAGDVAQRRSVAPRSHRRRRALPVAGSRRSPSACRTAPGCRSARRRRRSPTRCSAPCTACPNRTG